jgi:hypothetical protein
VRPNEIYRPSDIPQDTVINNGTVPLSPPPVEPVEYVQQADGQWVPFIPIVNPNAVMATTMNENMPGTKSGIHFAPVINVVGGDNTGTIDVDTAVPASDNVSLPQPLEEVYTKTGIIPSVVTPPPPPTIDPSDQTKLISTGGFSVKKIE